MDPYGERFPTPVLIQDACPLGLPKVEYMVYSLWYIIYGIEYMVM